MNTVKSSKIFKTYGIVIKEANSKDSDKVLTILTPDRGKVTAFAKGARKPKSRIITSSQCFCFSEFIFFEGSKMLHINSGDIIDSFYHIREDLEKIEVSFEILKIVNAVAEEGLESAELFSLILNTFFYLSYSKKNPKFIFSVFKIKLLNIMGYSLKLKKEKFNLNENNKKENYAIYDYLKDEIIEYRDSDHQDFDKVIDMKYLLNINIFSSVKYIYKNKTKKVFLFNLKEDVIEEFNDFTNIYFNKFIGKYL